MRSCRVIRVIALGLLFGTASGCVSAGGAASSSRPKGANSSILTAAEIAATRAPDVLRAIELARPQWLVSRPTGFGATREQVQVYFEANHYGELRSLQQLSTTMVSEIQYLDGRQATTRFGTGHGAGAILVRVAK